MTLAELNFRREDGTFVGVVDGLPYHVVPGDPHWDVAQALAAEMGEALPLEPPPPPPSPAPAAPTKAELLAQLQALQAQIAALAE